MNDYTETIRFPKADPTGTIPIGDLILEIVEPLPPPPPTIADWEKERREYYARLASEFVEALRAHLPGGLYDAIFAEFVVSKASLLSVRHSS